VNKAILLLVVIFIADLLMPFGIALALLYCVCIFIVIRENRRKIIIVAILASIFTIIKVVVHYSDQTPYYFFINRVITILTLWGAAALAQTVRLDNYRPKLVANSRTPK
jgi:membrane-bound ClpP family serine protease